MKLIIALLVSWLLVAFNTAQAADLDCTPSPLVQLEKIEARVIIVGELHGTEQTPAFVGQLVCGLLKLGRPVVLALERDGSEQLALNQYLASDGLATDVQALLAGGAWRQSVQDGRNSQAMLALIEQVRRWHRAGQRVGVLAMQMDWSPVLPESELGKEPWAKADADYFTAMNDRAMADKVRGTALAYPAYTVVALAGNMHTALGSASRAMQVASPSFSDLLTRQMAVHIVGVGSQGGSAWNLTAEGMGAKTVMRGPLFRSDSRVDSQVDLGRITASAPANMGS
ncbi:hypothetical protein [Pelomonas cellulosilytica]|uniref:Haem-binding uptake Tiki superfamily ChaN domain-containing protein n=1 Tax=Pelomonas cellulosilytica TaxID=2906762 RepID=A0ABS8XT42_9BURK|nr:hypothetical protein [Pelomonas sp. P8]MCE4554900.1 hypothetical protein [Pelomonas sp. P8]